MSNRKQQRQEQQQKSKIATITTERQRKCLSKNEIKCAIASLYLTALLVCSAILFCFVNCCFFVFVSLHFYLVIMYSTSTVYLTLCSMRCTWPHRTHSSRELLIYTIFHWNWNRNWNCVRERAQSTYLSVLCMLVDWYDDLYKCTIYRLHVIINMYK